MEFQPSNNTTIKNILVFLYRTFFIVMKTINILISQQSLKIIKKNLINNNIKNSAQKMY